ncbi:short chain dehydrogenase [Pseudomonas sp. Snoq117.2]|nr:short chain dehydrogenase [Pseudomonas sp. Snoq117.2]
MERRFADQTVVITGGCRGIGEGIAERFGREGANLVLVSNAERVHETAARLVADTGAEVLPLVVDITDEAAVADLYAQAETRFGRIDVSVQNAGIITHRRLRPHAARGLRSYPAGQHHRRLAVLPRGGQAHGRRRT